MQAPEQTWDGCGLRGPPAHPAQLPLSDRETGTWKTPGTVQGTQVNPGSPSFSLNTSVAGVRETQALDSVGTSMEPKGVGGGVMRDGPFQTCSQLLGPIPTLPTGPDPLLV